jgi:hypothetical protein
MKEGTPLAHHPDLSLWGQFRRICGGEVTWPQPKHILFGQLWRFNWVLDDEVLFEVLEGD